jgi:hypothetical protein
MSGKSLGLSVARFGALVAVLCVCAGEAWAQIPNCGSVSIGSNIWQQGYLKYVWADFETVSQITGCALELQTEGWIEGVGGALQTRQPHFAYLKIGRSVPSYGRWQSTGRHWVIWLAGLRWEFRGETHREVEAIPPPSDRGQGNVSLDCSDSGTDDVSRAGNGCDSPIVIDVAGDGYRLTSVRDGVWFDLDADGVPEQVAWTRAESDNAFLALDRNGNGRIDDGAELFGNGTPAYAGRREPRADNGFEALKFTEGASYGGVSRVDDRIDARDAVFEHLLLWTDRNHNGVSEPEELRRVVDTDLVAISTDYRKSPRRDRYGNEFRLRAKSWWRDGSMRPVFDVWLLTRERALTDE